MNQILAALLVLSVLVGGNILTMIYGWDLTPKSWGWIVGWGVFGQLFMKMIGDKVMGKK